MGDVVIFRGLIVLAFMTLGYSNSRAEDSADLNDVNITVRNVAGVVEVKYEIETPVAAMRFFQDDLGIRGPSWTLVEAPDLILARGTVRSITDKPFTSFRLRITPDTRRNPIAFFGVLGIGEEGALLSSRSLYADPEVFTNRLCIEDKPDVCEDFDADPPFFRLKTTGLVDEVTVRQGPVIYMGPAEVSEKRDYHLLFDERIPLVMQHKFEERLQQLIAYYRDRLYTELVEIPKLIVTWDPTPGEVSVSGRAFIFSTLLLDIRGPVTAQHRDAIYTRADYRLSDHMTRFFGYERIGNPEMRDRPWFYTSLSWFLAGESTNQPKTLSVSPRSLKRLVRFCQAELGNRPHGWRGTGTPLEVCGVVLHYLAAITVFNTSEGAEDWTDLLWESIENWDRRRDGFSTPYIGELKKLERDGRVSRFGEALVKRDGQELEALNGALEAIGRPDLVTPISVK